MKFFDNYEDFYNYFPNGHSKLWHGHGYYWLDSTNNINYSVIDTRLENVPFSTVQKCEVCDVLGEICPSCGDDDAVPDGSNYNLKNEPPTFGHVLLGVVLWDSELQNVGSPSNLFFSFGSEFGDIIYRLQKPNDDVRWCIFTIDRNYYIIKQQKVNNKWRELWTKQMDKDLSEAKKYCEDDAFQHYT